uniref:Uncharacterized protein n=1 Tax=Biomphalaria glabrata TaxID=6526 RepID=A0A2C9L455_BIOGL
MCGTAVGRKKRQAQDTVDAQVQSLNILFYNPQSQDYQKLKSQLASEEDTKVVTSLPASDTTTEQTKTTDEELDLNDLPPAARLQADELIAANFLNNSIRCVCLNYLIIALSILTILLKQN